MNEERVSPPLSPHESWNEEVVLDPTINILDLSSKKWNLSEMGRIHMPNQECMPQSVAVDSTRIYVSDPYNGQIHFFEEGKYLGPWPLAMHFNIPRYVICFPSTEVSWYLF